MRVLSVGCLLTLAAGLTAAAQDAAGLDPLLKILVENKVITLDQAQAVQAEYIRQKAQDTTVLKEDLSGSLKKSISPKLPSALEGLKVGGTVFFSMQNGNGWSGTKDQTTSYNRFVLNRAYLIVEKKITPWLDAKLVTDVFDSKASGGPLTVRQKYAYAYFHWKGNDFFNKPYFEVGLAHAPWVDFEESLYRYRMVQSTFLDKNGVLTSADLGGMFGSNFGPALSKEAQAGIGTKGGKWGSWAVGFYNGGGYGSTEANQNKSLEWRLSIRPFGEMFPGLQLQYAGVRGLGNKAIDNSKTPHVPPPDYNVNYYGVSYESKWVNAYYLYYTGDGNLAGTSLDTTSLATILPAAPAKGYTYFIEGKFPENGRFSAFYRYDKFDPNTNQSFDYKKDVTRYSDFGIAWWMYKANALVLDYSVTDHTKPWTGQPFNGHSAIPDDHRWQLTYQLKF